MLRIIKLAFLGIILFVDGFSQSTTYQQVKMGQLVPDISLGTVMNSDGSLNAEFSNSKISKSRGKIIILDFWHTGCTSCLEGFPKMSGLQAQFGDKIQVFLVNPTQNLQEIKTQLQLIKSRTGKSVIPSNLLVLTDAKAFNKLFPIRKEIPYHVWIGKDGKLVLRGISHNTHKKKIQELLDGKKISFIQDAWVIDYNKPLLTTNSTIVNSSIKYSSSFAKFINDHNLANPLGSGADNVIDLIAGTTRNILTNSQIIQLYNLPLKSRLAKSKILFGPKTIIEIADTSLIKLNSKDFYHNKPEDLETDEEFSTKKFTYEQISPITFSDLKRQNMMVEDLNRYFGNELSLQGNMEDREVYGLLLTVTHPGKLVKSKFKEHSERWKIVGGEDVKEDLGVILSEYFTSYFSLLNYGKINYHGSVINNLSYPDRVDLMLPPSHKIKSLEDLKDHLQEYGMDLVPGKKKVEMLVFKDVNLKNGDTSK